MTSFRPVSKADVRRWMWFGVITLAAIQLYYLQEMVAALMMFLVLLAFVAMTAFILFLLDRASQRTLAWAEPRTTRVAEIAHRGRAFTEELRKKLLHRPRSQTVK